MRALLGPHLDKGHTLYTDNYYTSPTLSKFLLSRSTATVGTVQLRRHGIPKPYNPLPWPEEIRKGDLFLRKTQTAHGPVLAILWKDKRKVSLLTTNHKAEWMDSGKVHRDTDRAVLKPDAVLDYNTNMRMVDKSDMMIGFIDCLRRSYKWYKKFILHAVDMCVLNAYYMYQFLNPDPATRKWKSLRTFQKQILEELLAKYAVQQPARHARHPAPAQALPDAEAERLNQPNFVTRHHLQPIPPTPGQRAGETKGRRSCVVCLGSSRKPKVIKKTYYECHHCKVALCITPCFVDYHSLAQY